MGGSNKRQKKRATMVAAAAVKTDAGSSPVEAHIINISLGGVGLYSRHSLEGRVQVAVCLRIGPDREVAESVWGKVTWKEKIGSSYAIGIAFEGLNHQEHSMLLSYLERNINDL